MAQSRGTKGPTVDGQLAGGRPKEGMARGRKSGPHNVALTSFELEINTPAQLPSLPVTELLPHPTALSQTLLNSHQLCYGKIPLPVMCRSDYRWDKRGSFADQWWDSLETAQNWPRCQPQDCRGCWEEVDRGLTVLLVDFGELKRNQGCMQMGSKVSELTYRQTLTLSHRWPTGSAPTPHARRGRHSTWGKGTAVSRAGPPCPPSYPAIHTHKGVLSHLSRTFTSTSRCSSRYLGSKFRAWVRTVSDLGEGTRKGKEATSLWARDTSEKGRV